jgi:hypothetical protein
VSALQQPRLRRLSLEQYYELGELGLLNQRTDLLEGIITDMEPIGPYRVKVGDIAKKLLRELAIRAGKEGSQEGSRPET